MHKIRANLIFILSVITFLALSATLWLFMHIIKNKNLHTSNVISTLEEKTAKKENSVALSNSISEINNTKATLDSYFVDSNHIDSFISYLENLGAGTNTTVKVKSFDPTSVTDRTLVVNISAEGTFTGVMNTIMLLENAPYKVHITKTYLNNQVATDQPPATTTTPNSKVNKPSIKTDWTADITFSVLITS